MPPMRPGRFVYHAAPEELVGSRLVPLFALEALDPGAFASAMAKYAGRESAPHARIPGLGIRFNDTVHCAPIHPWYVRQARLAEGVDPSGLHGAAVARRVYRIPIESFAGQQVIWFWGRTLWINGAPGEDVPLEPPADEFEPFDPQRYRELTAVPAAYREHLRACLARGKRPLMFVTIPHVLVVPSIDFSAAEVVDPAEPPDWERG